MSNRTYSAYMGFPINVGLLYIKCAVCGLTYTDNDYAKEYVNGDPSYYIEKNEAHIHFCGAICASKFLYPA